MRITFLVRSMAVGGAQRQLCVLCNELQQRGHEVCVLLYYVGEPLDAELAEHGIGIVDLQKRGRWRNFGFLLRLVRAVRKAQPDVLYAYLPGPNLLALLLRYLGAGCVIACGVRASETSAARVDWLTRLAQWLERRVVLHADVVIVNSQTGANHVCGDRRQANLVVIDNGIDTTTFCFDADGRRRMRSAWNVTDSAPIVGCVARLDPVKDHVTLLRGFALLRETHPDAQLICVGTFAEPYHSELRQLARQLGLAGAVQWVARESRLRDMYSGFDVLCLSSVSEGFPNVLAEAMACGVPCVATEVGDAARILSSADFLVPPRDPQSLAGALSSALRQARACSELRAGKIREEFSPRQLAQRTELALRAALERRPARSPGSGSA